MKKTWKTTGHILAFVLLTIVTQIGGVIWLINLGLISCLRKTSYSKIRTTGLFILLYSIATVCIIPFLAPLFGRVTLPVWESSLAPKSVVYCFFNRHYVRPEVRAGLLKEASVMETRFPGTKLYYLDAGFPFTNGFPLFPHLSHNDGMKVDLCFFYRSATDKFSNLKPSHTGYGVFEGPTQKEQNTTEFCQSKGYVQYDYPKFLTLGQRDDLIFDEIRTREMVNLLVQDKAVKKVFIEPHLKERLGMSKESKIRFQGCKAVRHDDHIHVEFSK
jgi:hypothetical protein